MPSKLPPSSAHFIRDEAELDRVVKRMAERERRLAWGVKAEAFLRQMVADGTDYSPAVAAEVRALIAELDQ